MDSPGLQSKVDYLYCDECKKHVPSTRVAPGVWKVECPQCIGECLLCECALAGYCFTPSETEKIPCRRTDMCSG